jgi:hypothetical protein
MASLFRIESIGVRNMSQPSQENPNELMKLDLQDLINKLDDLLDGPASLSDSDAHALAEAAGFRSMMEALKGQLDMARRWAEISIRTYESVASRSPSSKNGLSGKGGKYHDSAMALRSELIGKFGEVAGDFIQDPDRLKHWFLDGLELDIDKARELASKWKSLPTAEIQKLRGIKNKLKTLRPAFAKGTLSSDTKLRSWMELEKHLP